MSRRPPHFAVSVILFCMRRLTVAFIFFALFSVVADANADAAAEIKIGVLKFGTLSWVLDTIQHNGFDKAEGIELEVVPLATTGARPRPRREDLIASDWLWRNEQAERTRPW
jgi:NitT/TauT family transport system substrate-binding protein